MADGREVLIIDYLPVATELPDGRWQAEFTLLDLVEYGATREEAIERVSDLLGEMRNDPVIKRRLDYYRENPPPECSRWITMEEHVARSLYFQEHGDFPPWDDEPAPTSTMAASPPSSRPGR